MCRHAGMSVAVCLLAVTIAEAAKLEQRQLRPPCPPTSLIRSHASAGVRERSREPQGAPEAFLSRASPRLVVFGSG
ncbi:hypothetical protein NDU88_002577 [Pleurodeles waltl]|uniref:Secreted protein n=1 Tax=Pleurodeles waltl TaxID=8319 RepID=A0AAV7VAX7_PLEWA|nr:hypothetical protein NDU88_002577 [Pleurodeles waltl]